MKRLILLFSIMAIFPMNSLFSQDFLKLMHESPNPNLYEIQREFYKHWQGKDTTKKGIGWKQFKRYEDFWAPRVFPSGFLPRPDVIQQAIEERDFLVKKTNKVQNTNSWQIMGPFTSGGGYSGLGRVNVVRAAPNDTNTIWVGTASGGLWKTTNGGTNWSTNTDNLSIMPTLGINDLVFDINDPSVMYIATGDHTGTTYSVGVLKSTDAGTSWTTTGLNYNLNNTRIIYNLETHPTNNQFLYAATSNGIVRSTNGGTNWTTIKTGSHRMVRVNKSDPDILYAVNGSTYFRSTNGGTSWTSISSNLPSSNVNRLAMEVAPSNQSTIYILASSSASNFRGFYKSTDAGITWTEQSTTPNILGYEKNGSGTGGQGWYDLCLAVNPSNENNIIIGGINLWSSTDGGVNWTNRSFWYNSPPTPEVHADQHYITYMNGSSSTLLVGNDGGVYRSRNNATSWNYIGSGIHNTQFYRLGVSDVNPNYTIAGTQDNGSKLHKNGTWSDEIGGDGMECLIKPGDPNIMYGSIYYGNIQRSTNAGVNWRKMNDANNDGNYDDINETGAWVTPYLVDPNNPDHVYVGMKNVWKSTNNGTTFTRISSGWSVNLQILEIAPSNSNFIIASSGSNFRFSTDGGATWGTKTRPGSLNITSIKFHPQNHNILYATFSGYTSGEKVYRSTNFGDTWTNISFNLLNTPANCSEYFISPEHDRIFVGTDLGVYYLDNGSSTWNPFNTGLPQVIVRELEIQKSDTILVAATYGRGIWSIDLKGTLTLAKPNLIYPANNDVNIAIKDIPFKWNQTRNADAYEIHVSKSSNFVPLELNFTVFDTVGIRSVLSNYTNYYWRVRAIKNNIFSDWSDVFTFRSMIATPIIENPLDNAINVTPKDSLKWNIVDNAVNYQMQVATENEFIAPVIDRELATNQAILSGLNNYKDYFARARARSGDGWGLWSDVIKFKTVFGKPTLITPPNASTKVDTAAKFEWSKVDGTTSYRITLYKDNGTSLINVISQVFNNVNTTKFNYNLAPETEYKWRVVAKEGNIEMISDTFTFETRITHPILTFPINSRTISNYKVNFNINDEKFANNKLYEIEIYSNINGERTLLKSTISDALISNIDLENEIKTLKQGENKLCFDWRARAIKPSTQDTSAWSNFENFCYSLPKITLLTPMDNATDILTPEFSFIGSEGFEEYVVVFYKGTLDIQNRFTVNVNQSNLQGETYSIKNVSNSSESCNEYTWRVIGINGNDSIFSEYRKYNTIDTKVKTTTPNTNIVFKKNDFVFNWDAKPGFEEYEIIISEDDFQTILKQEKVKNTTYTLSNVNLLDEELFWKVRGIKSENNTDFACEWDVIERNKFYTLYSPPKLILPIKSEVLEDRKVQFKWSKVNLADEYEIIITATDFNQTYSTVDTTYSVTFPESVNDFTWKVVAKTVIGESTGQSEDSEIRDNTFDNQNSITDNFTNIRIYPNPTKDEVNLIGLNELDFTITNVEIYDLLSKKVFDLNQINIIDGQLKLNIKSLNTGTYILKLNSNSKQTINRIFIKE